MVSKVGSRVMGVKDSHLFDVDECPYLLNVVITLPHLTLIG